MDPQNAVQDLPVILVRPPRPGLLRRQQRFQPLPVLVGQVSASHGTEMGIQTRNVSRLQTRPSAAFSPDGTRIVTTSWDRTARIWDAASGEATRVLTGHDNVLNSAAFSPDGNRIVTAAGDKTVRIWDAASGAAVSRLTGHNNAVNSAAFSSD